MMKRGIAKYTAFCLAAGFTFTHTGAVVMAAGTETTLVGIKRTDFTAVTTVGEQSASEEETEDVSEAESEAVTEAAPEESADMAASSGEAAETPQETASEDTQEAGAQEAQAPLDTSMVGTTGFAVCSESVNVRSGADTQSEVVGTLRNHAAVEILGVDEYGWYKVRSGNVTGYVAGTFVATGEEAEQIAQNAGYTTAQVGSEVEALNVRSDASESSEIVGTVSGSDQIEVVADEGDWVKVVLSDGTYGYVSSDYVSTSTEYASAETPEEEQARLDQQWLDYLASQEADTSYGTSAPTVSASGDADESYTDTGSDTSYTPTADSSYDADYGYSDIQTSADAASSAYSVYLEAQDAADAAVANGADADTIYATAAAAQDAYASYLTAQNAADAAAAGYTDTASYDTGSTASYDTSYADSSYDTGSGASSEVQSSAETASSTYAAYVEAQNAADAAVANGANADTINATAAAAQEAYGIYVEAQNAADAAAANSAYTEAPADTSYSEDSYTENTDTAESSGTETYTDYSEDSYTEETSSQETGTASSTGAAIASYACQFVGNPYVYGGSSLTDGADCSGFVMSVFANYGISLPHNAAAQSAYGTSVSMDDLQPGDLLFYEGDGGIGHVTIYIGNGQVVHASNPSNGICISSVSYRTPCMAKRLV